MSLLLSENPKPVSAKYDKKLTRQSSSSEEGKVKNAVFWVVAPCRSYVYRRSCATSIHTRSKRRHIPEDGILHRHRCENLKSYKLKSFGKKQTTRCKRILFDCFDLCTTRQAIHTFYTARKEVATLQVLQGIRIAAGAKRPLPSKRHDRSGDDVPRADAVQ
jgi:hypothetical protein